jgi:hypothetical protein
MTPNARRAEFAVLAEKLAAAGLPLSGSRPFDTWESRHRSYQNFVLSSGEMLLLTDAARRGLEAAHVALVEMATEYIGRGEAMPPILAMYAAEVLIGYYPRQGKRRGKKALARRA